MQCIYVNNKPIYLTTVVEKETDFKNFLLKDVDLNVVLKTLSKKKINAVRLIGHSEDKLLKTFKKKLPNVIAGGGKVYNSNNKILFIYRNDKWDLPKGKAEKKEQIQDTAMREVEEETGVGNLKITEILPVTYHIYKRNGKHKLKITHWFKMQTTFDGPLEPQINEGITKVDWLDDAQAKDALSNSYANIKLLF